MPMHPKIDDESNLAYGEWKEGWRDIVEYEEIYEINHIPQVRNKKTQQILKPDKNFQISLMKNGKKHQKYIYHLVLKTFFPHIPQNGRTADHINENRLNNQPNNLQWLTKPQNSSKSNQLRPRNNGPALSKPVEQWSKDGTIFQREFSSVREAERITKINHQNISRCARGKLKSAGGFVWRFKELKSQEDLPGEIWETHDRLKEIIPYPSIRISNMGRILTVSGIKTKGSVVPGTSGHRRYGGHLVHQLVWAVFGDERPVPREGDKLVICHNDSIPRDEDQCASNAIEHLRLDSRRENALEYIRKKAKQ